MEFHWVARRASKGGPCLARRAGRAYLFRALSSENDARRGFMFRPGAF